MFKYVSILASLMLVTNLTSNLVFVFLVRTQQQFMPHFINTSISHHSLMKVRQG